MDGKSIYVSHQTLRFPDVFSIAVAVTEAAPAYHGGVII
jgi:hypothetical protein